MEFKPKSLILGVFLFFAPIWSAGGGLPLTPFSENEMHKPVLSFGSEEDSLKTRGNCGTAAMHDGFLLIPCTQTGFAFVDISDIENPIWVSNTGYRNNSDKGKDYYNPMREAHSMGFSYGEWGKLAATLADEGVIFYDWSDVEDESRKMLSYIDLPGIEKGDYDGAWWLFWQAPYVYVGGVGFGIYVVDATDPENPEFVNQLTLDQTGGFLIRPVFAVGNLLIATSKEGSSVFDISNPVDPVLMASEVYIPEHFESKNEYEQVGTSYSAMVNGNRLYGAQGEIIDLTEPSKPTLLRDSWTGKDADNKLDGTKGGYLTIQDGKAFMGNSRDYIIVDIEKKDILHRVLWDDHTEIGKADLDFVSVVGNLIVIGDDHKKGTRIYPHQKNPDTNPPSVNMVHPFDGSKFQALTSRVGLTFTDQIDLRSVNGQTFQVVERGSSGPLEGYYSGQTGIINFSPKEPLKKNTIYDVIVTKNGIRDFAGNATDEEFRSSFTTGSELPTTPVISGFGKKPVFKNTWNGTSLIFSTEVNDKVFILNGRNSGKKVLK